MTSSTSSKPLQGFTKLSPTIHLYRPSSFSTSQGRNGSGQISSSTVSLIVLCTWLGAHQKHISKYASTYRHLHPNASILILESSLPDVVYRTSASQQEDLEFACNIVYNQYHRPESFVLLHVFSNGGSNTATQLAATIASRKAKSSGPIFDGVVLDSCPGRTEGSYWRAVRAISVPLLKMNPILRCLGMMMVHLLLVALYVSDKVFGVPSAVDQARARLNDQRLFAKEVPRLYVYSKADEMIAWDDVHRHAEQAKELGYSSVGEMCLDNGKHCAHVMDDEAAYWGAVKRITDGNVAKEN